MAEADTPSGEPSPEVQETLQVLTNSVADPSDLASPFMARLGEDDRRVLFSQASEEWHAAGSVICREGDPGEALYIVKSGRIAVIKEVSEGRPTLLGYRGAGDIVGEMSVVSQQPRFASLIAVEPTDLLCVGTSKFSELVTERPTISWAILNVLNDRLHAADLARTRILREEQDLARRVERLTGEADRLAELARVRQETVELIVHDLRTPLAVIDGCMELMRASLSEEALGPMAEVLELARRNSRRLLALVEDLLQAGRQEVPGAALSFQPVDLVGLLERAVETARLAAAQADIRILLNLPGDLPLPRGDTAQLERVLENLLDNAVSYTPAGGRITVAAAERKGQIEVSVTDNGPGVPPQHREHIFERFGRVPGLEGRRQGFGLGLYFCRQVVQAHGGRIWVEPGPANVGSRFVLTLPLEDRGNDE
jgi:signal transduction histidine kinase